ncbi:MAG: zinc ribbon domain-containing protein [Pseudomonadota bacterium]
MPIYEYECGACGAVTDVLHKVSDKPPRKCPSCGALRLKRLISAPRFRLKGDGWYETDFKTGDKRNLADGGKNGDSKESSSADSSKADSKTTGDSKTTKREAGTTQSATSSGKSKSSGESA